MSHRPISLDRFSVDDLFYPENPNLPDTGFLGRNYVRLCEYFSSGEAERSSRVRSCPALVGYLLGEVARGRSELVESETTGHVSDTSVRHLERLVIQEGGRSIKGPEDSRGRASTTMLIGNTIIRYGQLGPLQESQELGREGEQEGYVYANPLSDAEEAAQWLKDLVTSDVLDIGTVGLTPTIPLQLSNCA